jgi:MFS family permease
VIAVTMNTSRAMAAAPRYRSDVDLEARAYNKVTSRLLPFLVVCYVIAYLDRVNIGFARLQMLEDLGFTETIYGLGAGIFFIGYFLFEVPSNLILHRVGARLWIGRIMITWGLVSALFMFTTTPAVFYLLRFLLGVAEAGFFPGIILYLTYWYPSERRVRMVALFMTAVPIAGVVGGPLSGWIMQSLDGTQGWRGWQWLFLLEAVPALLAGIAVMLYLDNGVRSARWLTDEEKDFLERRLAEDRAALTAHPSLASLFRDRRIWLLCAIYFCYVMGHYGLTFWMPVLVQAAGVSGTFRIGLMTAIPYGLAIVAMMMIGRQADARRERRWHTAVPMIAGAIGLVLSAAAGTHTAVALAGLAVASAGIFGSGPVFWALPTAFLGGTAAAAGIATINSIGNLAGFVSPYIVGWLTDLSRSTEAGMFAVAIALVVGALAVTAIPGRLVNR